MLGRDYFFSCIKVEKYRVEVGSIKFVVLHGHEAQKFIYCVAPHFACINCLIDSLVDRLITRAVIKSGAFRNIATEEKGR